ncbi:MAG TPA: response regulator transcription factor [Bacteroidia bacterium]|nr:response regulator transcription factor [Bacteroidia bacterium]
MNILLVDDDAMITELLSMKLGEKGYNVEQVSNGWDALKELSTQKYDLLITDLMMPDISGLTVISLLKNYVFGKIPVIIITSLDQSTMVLSGMGLGASDYFVKPINVEKLLNRIRKLTAGKA